MTIHSLDLLLSNLGPICCSMYSSNCCFLTWIHISQEADKVVWYSQLFQNFPQFVVIHTVKAFSLVIEAEVDVFLEFPCFFYDPTDVGNMISGSFAFSKSSLCIWKFSVHVLLKPSLKDFEHYLASMWNERNCMVFWNSLALPFSGIGVKTDLFQSCAHRNLKNNRMISVHFQGKPFNIMVIQVYTPFLW